MITSYKPQLKIAIRHSNNLDFLQTQIAANTDFKANPRRLVPDNENGTDKRAHESLLLHAYGLGTKTYNFKEYVGDIFNSDYLQ